MNYKLIIFDAADTILEKPELYPVLQSCFTSAGLSVTREELISKHKKLRETFDIPDVTGWDFYQEFNKALIESCGFAVPADLPKKIYQACGKLEWKAAPDVGVIKSIPTRKAILSNWGSSLRETLAHSMGGHDFDPIIISSEIGLRKPDPAFFTEAIRLCGVPAAEVLYVGDSPKLDYHPARACGLKPILLDRYGVWADGTFDSVKDFQALKKRLGF